ncbi:hypothetical protein Tco_0693143 [Tanacetum coccineum]
MCNRYFHYYCYEDNFLCNVKLWFLRSIDLNVHMQSILYFLRFQISPESSGRVPVLFKYRVIYAVTDQFLDQVEFFEGWKPLSPIQLAVEEATLVTWVDPEDDRVYTNISAYAPPAAPVQTPPSPEWSLSSLPVSPSSHVVPSPISSPVATSKATISVDEDQFIEVGAQLELHWSILHDHTQRLDALPPTLVADNDRDVRELYTRSGAVRDEIFSQRPVFALEAWAGHPAAMQRELQEMRGRVAALEQERSRRGQ